MAIHIKDTSLAAISLVEDHTVPLDRVLVLDAPVSSKMLLLQLARKIILGAAYERMASNNQGVREGGRKLADSYSTLVSYVREIRVTVSGIDLLFPFYRQRWVFERGLIRKGEVPHVDNSPVTDRDFALLCSLCVRVFSRSAQAIVAATGDNTNLQGRSEAAVFCELMAVISGIATEFAKGTGHSRDRAASLFALRGQAEAMPFLKKHQQVRLNRGVVNQIRDMGASALEDPDTQFVYDLAMLGLAENDPNFLRMFGEETWVELVDRAYIRCYPDFPGRALALAKYLDKLGRNEEADGFIQKAVSPQGREFGKPLQVTMVHAYLSSKQS